MFIDSKNLMNKNLILFFRDKGFTEEEIIKTVSDNSFFQYDYRKIDLIVKNSYNYLIEKGFSLEIIKKMTLRDPGFLTTSNEKKRKIDECFEKLGIIKNEIKK